MTTKTFFGCITTLVLIFLSCSQSLTQSNYVHIPKEGCIPDEKTAIKVAEALWLPVFGDDIYKEQPFVAKLKDEVWIVQGTLAKEYTSGGVIYIEIQKKDCKVLTLYHGK